MHSNQGSQPTLISSTVQVMVVTLFAGSEDELLLFFYSLHFYAISEKACPVCLLHNHCSVLTTDKLMGVSSA